MTITLGYDATHDNVSSLPSTPYVAGYTTGSDGIRWTADDWRAHPRAVRIDQDPSASDPTADILDVERGAATNSVAASWFIRALNAYNTALRPGQRYPGFYTSASNVTPLVNALIAGGVKSGPKLWVANWNLSESEAAKLVSSAGGPFPIIGVQYQNTPAYDISVWSVEWFNTVSRSKPTPPPPPPTVKKGNGMFLTGMKGFDDVYLIGGPKAPVVHVESPAERDELLTALPIGGMSRATIEKYFGPLPNTPTPSKH